MIALGARGQVASIHRGAERTFFSETQLPLETLRKGASVAAGASVLLASGSEIGLLRLVSSTFEASVQSLPGGQAMDCGDSTQQRVSGSEDCPGSNRRP